MAISDGSGSKEHIWGVASGGKTLPPVSSGPLQVEACFCPSGSPWAFHRDKSGVVKHTHPHKHINTHTHTLLRTLNFLMSWNICFVAKTLLAFSKPPILLTSSVENNVPGSSSKMCLPHNMCRGNGSTGALKPLSSPSLVCLGENTG